MLLSDDELTARLDSPLNLMNRLKECTKVSKVEVRPMSSGNKGEAVPSRVRELLGVLAVQSDETQDDIADIFDVSQGLVGQSSRGLVGNRVDADLKASVDEAKRLRGEKTETAHDEALNAMVECIAVMRPQLKTIQQPEKLAKIAGDMSKVIKNLKQNDDAKVNNTQVIVYAPSQVNENHYETIEA